MQSILQVKIIIKYIVTAFIKLYSFCIIKRDMNYGNQEVELLIQKFLSGTINFDKDESWQRLFVYDSFYF